MELECTVYGSEERAIEPPATLGDQLGYLNGCGGCQIEMPFQNITGTHLIRRVGNGVRRLDIMKDPCSTPFRHEFPAQDLQRAIYEKRRSIS